MLSIPFFFALYTHPIKHGETETGSGLACCTLLYPINQTILLLPALQTAASPYLASSWPCSLAPTIATPSCSSPAAVVVRPSFINLLGSSGGMTGASAAGLPPRRPARRRNCRWRRLAAGCSTPRWMTAALRMVRARMPVKSGNGG